MKKILCSILLIMLIISSAVGFSASSNIPAQEPVDEQHLTRETDIVFSTRTNVDIEPYSLEDAHDVLGFELDDTDTFSMQELEKVLGFMPIDVEADFGLSENNVEAKIINVKAFELEEDTYLEEIVVEYVPLDAYLSNNSITTATAASASGTVYLSAVHSYYDDCVLRARIHARASFDWNKDDGTVHRYNEEWSILKNSKLWTGGDYIRHASAYFYYSDKSLFNKFSRGMEVNYTYEAYNKTRKINLRCYSDGDWDNAGDKNYK